MQVKFYKSVALTLLELLAFNAAAHRHTHRETHNENIISAIHSVYLAEITIGQYLAKIWSRVWRLVFYDSRCSWTWRRDGRTAVVTSRWAYLIAPSLLLPRCDMIHMHVKISVEWEEAAEWRIFARLNVRHACGLLLRLTFALRTRSVWQNQLTRGIYTYSRNIFSA